MGQLKKGVLGGFSGKVGNVVGSSWMGRNVIRSLPTPTKKLPTLKQALARQRLGAGSSFLKPLAQVVKVCYQHSGNSTKWNLLCKNTFARTFKITSDGNHFGVNLSEIKVSMGILESLGKHTVYRDGMDIKIAWRFCERGCGNGDDVLRVLCFDYEKGKVCLLPTNVTRQSEEVVFSLPSDFKDESTAIYVFFSSRDNKLFSDSEYINVATKKLSVIEVVAKKLCAYRSAPIKERGEEFSLRGYCLTG